MSMFKSQSQTGKLFDTNKLSVSVYGFETCEHNRQKYTVFKVLVKLGAKSWTVERRYNEFDRINSEIKRVDLEISSKFPGKKYLGDNFNVEFIKKRMAGLDEFIKDVASNPACLRIPAVIDFLEINQNYLADERNGGNNNNMVMTSSNNRSQKSGSNSPSDLSPSQLPTESDLDDLINLGASHNPAAKPSDFEFLNVIGKGSFGKVYMVNHKVENKIYAIKVLSKEAIIRRNEVKHIMTERNVLIKNLKHPFLIGLHYSFQSNDKLYFVLDYVNGGELFFHLSRQRVFPEYRVKFYSAEISNAIGYMHSEGIIYRDLKPENILIDSQGHIKLTDFGLCKEGIQATTTTGTFCGTPEYLAPEILLKRPYTRAVDWWCLGSVVYEMLYGLPPFYSRDTNEMYNNILHNPLRFNHEIAASQAARSIISELLIKDPAQRLGASEDDFLEIQEHPFFSDISWDDLVEKRIPVPWIPDLDSRTDLKHIDPEFTQEQVPASLGQSLVSSCRNFQSSAFTGFTYIPDSNLK